MPAGERRNHTFYEEVGGAATFEKLVRVFYAGVRDDEILRPLYPEEDLAPAERRLRMFLEQYWGGPSTYSAERGHPRLRMRHHPFVITEVERDRWLLLMERAVDAIELDDEQRSTLWAYLVMAANSLVNTPSAGR